MGFFQKKPSNVPTHEHSGLPMINGSATRGPSSSLTPAPSSDPPEEPESLQKGLKQLNGVGSANGLPSPITPANGTVNEDATGANGLSHFNSPSRKVSQLPKQQQCLELNDVQAKKAISYAESADEEDEDDVFNPPLPTKRKGRMLKRRKTSPSPDADDFVVDAESELDAVDEGKKSHRA